MLVRGMVQHHVQNDADVMFAATRDEAIEVCQRTVLRVDSFIVGDVVAEVDLGRRIHRRDPDGINAEMLEITEPLCDAVEIAYAVAVRVLKGPWVDLIDHGVLPPTGADGG